MRSWPVLLVGFCLLGCSRESTRIVLRDPHAVSLFVVANQTRTLVLPPDLPAPLPPTGNVERALWQAHEVAPRRSLAFRVEPAPGDSGDVHGEAYRFGPGGISVAYVRGRRRSGGASVLDDDGVLILREGVLARRAATWSIDRDALVARVRLPMFDSNHVREGRFTVAYLELEVPLVELQEVDRIRVPFFGATEVTRVYPP
jgi:hypothetical protein